MRYGDCVREKNHLYQYYNFSIGLMVYINGSNYNQCELVEYDCIHIAIGFGDPFPDTVRKRIEDIGSVQ